MNYGLLNLVTFTVTLILYFGYIPLLPYPPLPTLTLPYLTLHLILHLVLPYLTLPYHFTIKMHCRFSLSTNT